MARKAALVKDLLKSAEEIAERLAVKAPTPAPKRLAVKPVVAVVPPPKPAKKVMATMPPRTHFPVRVREGSAGRKIIETKAQQMALPVRDRIQYSGSQIFGDGSDAAEETLRRVPQTPLEDILASVPRRYDDKAYPKNDRIRPFITHRDEIADLAANYIKDISPNAASSRFYKTGPMYRAFDEIAELGRQGADDYMRKDFMPAFAGTSPRTPTPENLRNASMLMYLREHGDDLLKAYPEYGNYQGYGTLGSNYKLADRLRQLGPSWDANPKPTNFGYASIGDQHHVASDTHNIRGYVGLLDELYPGGVPEEWFETSARAKYRAGEGYKPSRDLADTLESAVYGGRPQQVEYGPMFDLSTLTGDRLGITGSEAQSRLWTLLGEKTGLVSPEKSIPDLGNEAVDITAQVLGVTPEETLRMLGRKEIPTMATGGRVDALSDKYGVY
jgi:hypothetical protein